MHGRHVRPGMSLIFILLVKEINVECLNKLSVALNGKISCEGICLSKFESSIQHGRNLYFF